MKEKGTLLHGFFLVLVLQKKSVVPVIIAKCLVLVHKADNAS